MWIYPEIATLGDIVRYHGRTRPDATALIVSGKRTSYFELDRESNRLATAILERQLGIVGYLGKNSAVFCTALFGAAKAGVTFLAMNWRLAGPELSEILSDCECRLVFVDPDLMPLAQSAAQGLPEGHPITLVCNDAESMAAFMGAASDSDPNIAVSGESTAMLLYTSGTTGTPKGVELSHANFNMLRLCEHLDCGVTWEPDDVYLMYMPNFHTSGTGLMLQALYNGAAVFMLSAFEPGPVLDAIVTARPTITLIVPSALQILLDHPGAEDVDFSCFRLCMYAGSPISLELITRAMVRMNCKFVQWYGATEVVGAATLLRADQHILEDEQRLKSCGTPVPLADIRIESQDGRLLEPGEVGEVVLRMPSLFKGYWGKPNETAAVKKNGWYRTGDAGYRDAEGYLYIVDRIKDMIVSGGENVYSAEVERVLLKHPGIAEAAVIGVLDAKWGEAVTAIVVLRKGQSPEPDDIITFCRGYLGGYKVPKSIVMVDSLPRNSTGKIQKALLRNASFVKAVSHA